ncbi:hypothetical protein [Telmatospirillum sp. J64-1]|nr:hypothetical protein [Telmatospirillum sp. J64-1]
MVLLFKFVAMLAIVHAAIEALSRWARPERRGWYLVGITTLAAAGLAWI